MGNSAIDPKSLPKRTCDLCGSSEKRLLYVKYGYDMVRCGSCGLMYVDALPTTEQLNYLYSKEFYSSDEENKPEWSLVDYEEQSEVMVHNFFRKLDRAKGLIPEKGRLLDVGCAHGFFLEALKDKYDVYGVDVSEYATQYAREKLGLKNVLTGIVEKLDLPKGHFDLLTMWNSLDHVAHPLDALKAANRLLAPDGTLVVYVEDVGCWLSKLMGSHWFPVCPPIHLTYFDKDSMRKALEATGFEIKLNAKVGVVLRLKDVVNRIQIQARSEIAYKMYRMIENNPLNGFRINLGSGGNMFVVAKKVRDVEKTS